jgi:predicted nucleotidyltransferase
MRLFLFGSFVRGDARLNSDIDLGYEMQDGISIAHRTWILNAVVALPKIRPSDIVDFASVSPALRNVARGEQRDLPCPLGLRRLAAIEVNKTAIIQR